jgi:FixJ family two-component response regulator
MRQYNPKTEPIRDDTALTAAPSADAGQNNLVKILVADSDKDVCDSLKNLLSGLQNVSVECFCDAKSLLACHFDNSVACLVAEVDLPDISGVEVLEQLNSRGLAIPTIILAACSDVPTAVRAMQAKAVDFIEKPFVESLLLKRIKQILQSHRGK